ncbi:MAG: hypothetical protein GY773_05905 [Actinomycetia bacterium]|nr:hypothetical protein [Actinomycetes bacterium]MCP5033568.1 hypothetical protein [Actinomycetes bacterium]
MAKKALTLDTPFRKGEQVQTTLDLDDIPEGTTGNVKLANGLGNWRRYWIMFTDGQVRGQISHDQLVRPSQLVAWQARKKEQAQDAQSDGDTAAEASAEVAAGGSDLASRIPAAILERSRAAKARLLD